MKRLRNLFSLVLLLCLVALTGSGSVSVADITQTASERPCECGDKCYGCPYDINNDGSLGFRRVKLRNSPRIARINMKKENW